MESVANLAEDRKSQISFTPLDSSKETSVQSTILGESVLANPQQLPFGLNPVTSLRSSTLSFAIFEIRLITQPPSLINI